jgi:hypothetical protein
VKSILLIISLFCCLAGIVKPTAQPPAQAVSTTLTVFKSFFPYGTNDLSPSAAPVNSPAHAYQLVGITPSHIEASTNRFFSQAIFQSGITTSDIHQKTYLLHIHPSHSIW